MWSCACRLCGPECLWSLEHRLRERGDAGESLGEVERYAFGLEDAAGWALDGCDDGAGCKGLTVKDWKLVVMAGSVREKAARYDVLSAEDAGFARDELSRNVWRWRG